MTIYQFAFPPTQYGRLRWVKLIANSEQEAVEKLGEVTKEKPIRGPFKVVCRAKNCYEPATVLFQGRVCLCSKHDPTPQGWPYPLRCELKE